MGHKNKRENTASLSSPRPSRQDTWLTAQEHSELLVVKLGLLVGHQGTWATLPHRVHEAHAWQCHLLAAALVTEALPAPAAVVLRTEGPAVSRSRAHAPPDTARAWNPPVRGQECREGARHGRLYEPRLGCPPGPTGVEPSPELSGSPPTGTNRCSGHASREPALGEDVFVVPFCLRASAHLSGQKVKLGVTLHTSWALGEKATEYQSPALSLAKWPRPG